MREYKFRGKRLDNGEWVYGDLIHGDISNSIYIKTAVSFVVWESIAWYTYPCDAFKQGLLSLRSAPARCIE